MFLQEKISVVLVIFFLSLASKFCECVLLCVAVQESSDWSENQQYCLDILLEKAVN